MTTPEIIATVLAGARFFKKPAEDVASSAVKDAYQAVKSYLRRKFTSLPDAQTALEKAEEKPESEARKAVLLEEVETLHLDADNELAPLVKELRAALGPTTMIQQNVTANQTGRKNTVIVAGRDVIQPLHHTTKQEVKPDERHVTSAQKKEIKELIDELAIRLAGKDGAPNYKAAWGRLYDEFGVTSYHLLPVGDFEAAVRYLREQKAISRSRLRRRNPQAYRNDFYATIHASAKTLGWTEDQIYDFAEEKLEKKPIRSLRKLGPNQLKKLSECIARKSNQLQAANDGSSKNTVVQ